MKKFILVLPFLLCQCSSMEKSVGLGIGLGAASGITASQLAHYNTKGHVVLAVGGAVIGGTIAALLHKNHPEVPTPIPVPITNIPKDGHPPLADPEKDAILVPDKIEGDQFIESHRVWTIKKPARWQLRKGDNSDEKEEASSDE